jgi:phytoene synthase
MSNVATPGIQDAYRATEQFVRRRSRTFRLVTSFLPSDKRRAAWVTYAFFRKIDDLVDREQVSLAEFRTWREQAMQPVSEQSDPLLVAWADIRERYAIDPQHVQNLFDGIEMDLAARRYETLEELHAYCYRVASSAALLALPVIGLRQGVALTQAETYVAKMSIAVQMTDILCDVGEDLEKGRIYLPRAELASFGLSYAHVEARVCDDRFKRLMRQLVRATRNLLVEAWPMLDCFSGPERLATGFGAALYRAYLDEIERKDFDVFTHRVHFGLLRKLGLLLTKWPAIVWPGRADYVFNR